MKPGVYDLTAEEYHSDPVPEGSLSSTGARDLLKAPAVFHHKRTNPPEYNPVFDFGTVAHKLVLGAGDDLCVIDAKDWRTKKAQEERDTAREGGRVPILVGDYQTAMAMAKAVGEHPLASMLFRRGKPEQALIWHDIVWRRALVDWLPDPVEGRRMFVTDYKTAKSASPAAVAKSIAEYGYHQQAAWYLDGVRALKLADDPAFLFVFQEKTAPYLVTVVEPDESALEWGRVLNRKAVDVYRRCTESGLWPGYSDDVILAQLPAWAERQYENAYDRGDYDLETA